MDIASTMKKLLAALLASLFAVGAFAADAPAVDPAAPAVAAAKPMHKKKHHHHKVKKAAVDAPAAAAPK